MNSIKNRKVPEFKARMIAGTKLCIAMRNDLPALCVGGHITFGSKESISEVIKSEEWQNKIVDSRYVHSYDVTESCTPVLEPEELTPKDGFYLMESDFLLVMVRDGKIKCLAREGKLSPIFRESAQQYDNTYVNVMCTPCTDKQLEEIFNERPKGDRTFLDMIDIREASFLAPRIEKQFELTAGMFGKKEYKLTLQGEVVERIVDFDFDIFGNIITSDAITHRLPQSYSEEELFGTGDEPNYIERMRTELNQTIVTTDTFSYYIYGNSLSLAPTASSELASFYIHENNCTMVVVNEEGDAKQVERFKGASNTQQEESFYYIENNFLNPELDEYELDDIFVEDPTEEDIQHLLDFGFAPIRDDEFKILFGEMTNSEAINHVFENCGKPTLSDDDAGNIRATMHTYEGVKECSFYLYDEEVSEVLPFHYNLMGTKIFEEDVLPNLKHLFINGKLNESKARNLFARSEIHSTPFAKKELK